MRPKPTVTRGAECKGPAQGWHVSAVTGVSWWQTLRCSNGFGVYHSSQDVSEASTYLPDQKHVSHLPASLEQLRKGGSTARAPLLTQYGSTLSSTVNAGDRWQPREQEASAPSVGPRGAKPGKS